MPSPNDRAYLAQYFTQYDPYQVKKREPVWMGVAEPSVLHSVSVPTIIDWRSVEFSAEEQLLLMANKFRSLGRFQFVVRTAQREGDITGLLRPMSIERLDRNLYPDLALVAEAQRQLMQRDGVPVERVLHEIAARLRPPQHRETQSERTDKTKSDAHTVPLYTQEEQDDFESLREEA